MPSPQGSHVRAKIIRRIDDAKNQKERDLEDDPDHIKFTCLINGEREEVVSYNQIVDCIEEDQTWDGTWKFREILDHKKVKPTDKDHKGCSWNLLIEWETGERTWEPLQHRSKDGAPDGIWDLDKVTVATHARKHKL